MEMEIFFFIFLKSYLLEKKMNKKEGNLFFFLVKSKKSKDMQKDFGFNKVK